MLSGVVEVVVAVVLGMMRHQALFQVQVVEVEEEVVVGQKEVVVLLLPPPPPQAYSSISLLDILSACLQMEYTKQMTQKQTVFIIQ